MIFWDLNCSLGCSPLALWAYPTAPFPEVYNVETFGVGQGTEEFLPLNPQSVALPPELSRLRLDYGQLWQEPAIPGLDWLFTPIRKLEEHLPVVTLQASTTFKGRFTLLTNRSSGFGSHSCDLRHFHTSPLVNCGLLVSLRILYKSRR